jgi:hypothetical protein
VSLIFFAPIFPSSIPAVQITAIEVETIADEGNSVCAKLLKAGKPMKPRKASTERRFYFNI